MDEMRKKLSNKQRIVVKLVLPPLHMKQQETLILQSWKNWYAFLPICTIRGKKWYW